MISDFFYWIRTLSGTCVPHLFSQAFSLYFVNIKEELGDMTSDLIVSSLLFVDIKLNQANGHFPCSNVGF